MISRERVRAAFNHEQPDFTPCDYYATPEIHQGLLRHFGVSRDDELRDCLGTDLRFVEPEYVGPPLPEYENGSTMDTWGVIRKPMPNEYGEYAEPVNLPYAEWTKVEEAEAFNWPHPDWYDYSTIPAQCEKYSDYAVIAGSFGVQNFINGVAFGRGVEQVLMDIALEDPVYLYIVERRHRFYLGYIERILDAAKGRIDVILCGDDLGSQRGLLVSPETFDKLFQPKKKELFDMVHAYGARVSHHCCGSSRALFPRFIEIGMDALQTVQPQAEGMDPFDLKREFAGQIVLHGGVDVQGWLQRETPDEIARHVNALCDEVGSGGGYVLAPCHNIQPDTPLENVLALYNAAAARRK